MVRPTECNNFNYNYNNKLSWINLMILYNALRVNIMTCIGWPFAIWTTCERNKQRIKSTQSSPELDVLEISIVYERCFLCAKWCDVNDMNFLGRPNAVNSLILGKLRFPSKRRSEWLNTTRCASYNKMCRHAW